jgi:predicted polyphosphate/ATP-dependent NAD kinase
MRKVGFLINPISGMGGSVGLKGTDGEIYKKALELGAVPTAPERASQFLSSIKQKQEISLVVAPGKMGEDYVKKGNIKFKVVGEIGDSTNAEDTKRIAKQMIKRNIEILIFCGGDGTARDIYDAIELMIPVIAIPTGVKMYSSVFALNPRSAAQILDLFIAEAVEMVEREVLDINEELYRKNKLESKLYGYLKVPKVLMLIQSGKTGSSSGMTVEENKKDIAQFVIEDMQEDSLYLLGPGTTVKAITEYLNLPKTLLGIDGVYEKEIIGSDLNENRILELIGRYPNTKIVVSPLGGQGFIFGRGNKQFTPKVLKKVESKNIIIVSTSEKIRELKCLRVDTGNVDVDNSLKGFARVIIGYMEQTVIPVEC